MIDINIIWQATDGGRIIIQDIYPQSKTNWGKKNFTVRPDDKKPSAGVFQTKGAENIWLLQDKGGKDNKAKNAITLISEHKGLSYFEALQFIIKNYCNGQAENINTKEIKPQITNTGKPQEGITIEKSDKFENLNLLGPHVTEEMAAKFNLFELTSYTTSKGFKIHSSSNYPVFYYDYGSWGKIYCPFAIEYRFLYVGKKPENQIFADAETQKMIDIVKAKGSLQQKSVEDEEGEKTYIDGRLKHLIICSGPSDAINVYAAGYNVVWFNSETAVINDYQYNQVLRKIAINIYILPDLDDTGKNFAIKTCLQFIDIRIIWLPRELANQKTINEKPCKDIRDFFMYYRDKRYSDKKYFFRKLVESALTLCFWITSRDKNGNEFFDISNENLYSFLQANGYFTFDSKNEKKGFGFMQIDKNNVIHEIPEEKIQENVNSYLIGFIKENLEHFNIKLLNTIHRSNQVKTGSLAKLRRIEVNTKNFGNNFDYVFFRNFAVSITGKEILTERLTASNRLVKNDHIIDFDFKPIDAPFEIEFKDTENFNLSIIDKNFSYLNFLYNTGSSYWRNETLTADQKKEHDLHFINKCAIIGYLMHRYKDPANAYAPYCLETELNELGTHAGGTGKSIFIQSLEFVRKLLTVDGQKKSLTEDKHLFGNVKDGFTEIVFIDDLRLDVPLSMLFNSITGKMEVEPKFVQKYVLDFDNSPKIAIASNHPLINIDGSTRRRLWFAGFSDYYHADNPGKQMKYFSPYHEFGKTLIKDYTPDEMNRFYNFLMHCLKFYLATKTKIDPPLARIETRNLQGAMGDEFLYWAEQYFNAAKLNTNLPINETFEDFRNSLPASTAKYYNARKFKTKLQLFAQMRNYIFNPEHLKTSALERERNYIRDYAEGKDVYCFYFATIKEGVAQPLATPTEKQPVDTELF